MFQRQRQLFWPFSKRTPDKTLLSKSYTWYHCHIGFFQNLLAKNHKGDQISLRTLLCHFVANGLLCFVFVDSLKVKFKLWIFLALQKAVQP